MKKIFYLAVLMFLHSYANAQEYMLIGKTWKYNLLGIISSNDTLILYNKNSDLALMDVRNIKIRFQSGGIYQATTINNDSIQGTWQLKNNDLVVDSDTIQNFQISDERFIYKKKSKYTFPELTLEGVIYHVMEYSGTSMICESLTSGNWDNSSVWSCGRVPEFHDDAIIHSGHKIKLTPAMGVSRCRKLEVKKGGIFDNTSTLFLAKP